jgi:hypothetical protein
MPRIKRISLNSEFNALNEERTQHNENNDCVVKAVALSFNLPYSVALAELAAVGREARKGTFSTPDKLYKIAKKYGYRLLTISPSCFIDRYPAAHARVLKSVTTHHPRRFNNVWKDGRTYILLQSRHVSVCRNGELIDWAVNSAKRAETIYLVVKEEEALNFPVKASFYHDDVTPGSEAARILYGRK